MKKITYKKYIVGGFVRDALLGIKSNDIDYSVVIENKEDFNSPFEALMAFKEDLITQGYEILVVTERTFTIKAKNSETNEVDDFVLARKESGYKEGTREPEEISLGTLREDLERRDFTVNALCVPFDQKDINYDNVIDMFDGVTDLITKVLKTPLSPKISFEDDPLRILRGFRFCCMKNFIMDDDVVESIQNFDMNRFKKTVSKERVREEIKKMFNYDTFEAINTIKIMELINPELYHYIFKGINMRLEPTFKK